VQIRVFFNSLLIKLFSFLEIRYSDGGEDTFTFVMYKIGYRSAVHYNVHSFA